MALTVKGVPMNQTQITCAEILLNVANTEQTGEIAAEACIFAAIFESSVGLNLGWDSSNPTYGGPLAGNRAYFASVGSAGSQQVASAQAFAFFKGGKGYQAAGAIALARTSSDPAYIASQVEAATPFNAQGYSTQYLGQGFPFEKAVAEAKAIVAAHGGHALKGGVAGAGGSGTTVDGSGPSQYDFRIGGTSNPDEDYWTGINRLAQEVNWYLFSNGECLYYMDGPEMIAQKPAMHIDRIRDSDRLILPFRGAYDNTAYTYVSDHLRKFRVQRKTHLTAVTSPTQVTLSLVCGIDELRAGDVVVLSSFGPMDGRWIVGDVWRSVFASYSQVTLVPPIAPITEAAAAGTTGKSATSTTTIPGADPVKLTGTLRNHVVQAALAAAQREKTSHAYVYDEVRPMPASLFGAAPVKTDCSGFATLCYKDAGAPDPNGFGYNGQGNTTSLVAKGSAVKTAQPADLLFYAGAAPLANGIGHVAVYVGNGQVVSNGGPGDPREMSMTAPGPILAMRSYL